MAKIGLSYDDCDSVSTSLENVIDYARIDRGSLQDAKGSVPTAYADVYIAVSNAYDAVDTAIGNIETFKSDFKTLVDDIKSFDGSYKASLDTVQTNISSTVTTVFNILTSGTNGGYGALKTTLTGLTARCHLEYLANGRIRVVSDAIGRSFSGIKYTGKTYAFGSPNYYGANLDRFMVKGDPSSVFFQKYFDNIASDAKGAITDIKASPWDATKAFGRSTFLFEQGDKIGNAAKGIAYVSIAYDVSTHVYTNVQNGASAEKITADVTTDVVRDLGGMAVATGCAQVGAAVGTAIPIPVVGTVAGAAVGFVAGYVGATVYNYLVTGVNINGKSVSEWVSTGVEKGIHAVEDAADYVGDKVSDAVDYVGNKISDAADSVGDCISGVGEFLFG